MPGDVVGVTPVRVRLRPVVLGARRREDRHQPMRLTSRAMLLPRCHPATWLTTPPRKHANHARRNQRSHLRWTMRASTLPKACRNGSGSVRGSPHAHIKPKSRTEDNTGRRNTRHTRHSRQAGPGRPRLCEHLFPKSVAMVTDSGNCSRCTVAPNRRKLPQFRSKRMRKRSGGLIRSLAMAGARATQEVTPAGGRGPGSGARAACRRGPR